MAMAVEVGFARCTKRASTCWRKNVDSSMVIEVDSRTIDATPEKNLRPAPPLIYEWREERAEQNADAMIDC
eukprot:scaffold41430_cov266-Skeletonema_dohrnii-CCMP3373.AAC.1